LHAHFHSTPPSSHRSSIGFARGDLESPIAEAWCCDTLAEALGSSRLLSFACGALYFATIPWHPFPGSVIVKGLSVATLALIALQARIGPNGTILAVTLSFSALGDVLLDLDPQRLFVFGLSSFLLAHLTYIVLFSLNWPKPSNPGSPRLLAMAAMAAYSAVFSAWLWPALGALKLPVVFYICAITTMSITAIGARFASPWVVAGAILFVASDSLLAANKFRTPLPLRDYLVWATYYLGQCGIALGFLASVQRTVH
jgi:uncharacterized membrane protein YhhN